MKDSKNAGQLNDGMADLLGYSPVWYWMISFIILGIIMLTVFFLLKLTTKDEEGVVKPQKLKQPLQLAAEIDEAFVLVSNNVIPTEEACQRVSIILREFLQSQTNIPASSMTVAELEKIDAPYQVVENLKYIYPIVFSDKKVASRDDFILFMNSSRAVVDGTWN